MGNFRWDLDGLLETDLLIKESLKYSGVYYESFCYFDNLEKYLLDLYHKSELYTRNITLNIVKDIIITTTFDCYNRTGLYAICYNHNFKYYKQLEFIGSTDMIDFFYSGFYNKFVEGYPLWGYAFVINSLGNIRKIDGDKLVTYYSFLNSPYVIFDGVTKEEVFKHLRLS